MGRVLEVNKAFMLTEVDARSGLGKELEVRLFPNPFVFTPYGAADLARRLLNWAANNNDEIGHRYPSFTGDLNSYI